MTSACPHDIPAERWIDFFADELDEEASAQLEQLMFECPACTQEAERWGAVVGSAGQAIPPVISNEALLALQGRGERMNENPMRPGEHRQAGFPEGGRLLIHRLQGLDLTGVERVDLALSTPEGAPLAEFNDVPFDANVGEVLIACQRHFGESFPEKIVFAVARHRVDQVDVVATYSVDHRY